MLYAVCFALVWQGVALRAHSTWLHQPGGCPEDNLQNEQLSSTDIFMRSYRGDLEWLDYSVPSITESMQCSVGVIRNVLLVVPEDDVSAFQEKLKVVWTAHELPKSLFERWHLIPSKTKIIGSGSQEQMLDKMHADLYTNAAHFVYVDTDTVFMQHLARNQLFDDEGRPFLCVRSVANCDACEMSMQGHVKSMLGDGEMLDHDYMCLGQAYPRFLYQHLREIVQAKKGEPWRNFTSHALHPENGGGSPWTEDDGFTEFNAMGAAMWRDFHEKAHWIDSEVDARSLMVQPLPMWSWEQDEATREQSKKRFECLRRFKQNRDGFDRNARLVKCNRLFQKDDK